MEALRELDELLEDELIEEAEGGGSWWVKVSFYKVHTSTACSRK